jgi:hypothetical protein
LSIVLQPSTQEDLSSNEETNFASGAESLLAAVVYADLFDYPLTIDDLLRYQVGTRLTRDEIYAALSIISPLREALNEDSGFYVLRGREATIGLRRARTARSRRLWPRARTYARIASYLPFVRCVAVTGALAVENLGARPDIDLLVVAQRHRVWICRRALILLVRAARLLGDDLCPNYIISVDNLTLDQRDFFTAHELAQMVPIVGREYYDRIISNNKWALRYLPNAFDRPAKGVRKAHNGLPKRLVEAILSRAIFDKWEAWELSRMRRQLQPILGVAAEVVCSPSQCKGHTGLHRQSVLGKFVAALKSRNLYAALAVVEQRLEDNVG